jgi:hypothetical protein
MSSLRDHWWMTIRASRPEANIAVFPKGGLESLILDQLRRGDFE